VSSLALGCGDGEGLGIGSAREGATEDVAVTEQTLINGWNDYSDLNRDAAVQLTGQYLCSGTLVAPDMVLTAGHCLDFEKPAWEDDPVVGKGTWRPMGQDQTVSIGPDPATPRATYAARWANSAGLSDIALILLAQPVPESVARPAAIMTAELYAAFGGLSDKILYQATYGSECSGTSIRRFGYVRYEGGSPRGVNSFGGLILNWGEPQILVEQGDSGGSLFWWNPNESRLYLTGDFVGWSGSAACTNPARNRPHYVGTFMTGEGDATRPNISAWLTEQVTPTLRRNTFQPFAAGDRWHDYFCVDDEVCGIGDFNGDGRDDIIRFEGANTDVWVGLSYGFRTQSTDPTGRFLAPGSGFESNPWHRTFAFENDTVGVLDINDDGKDDIFYGNTAYLWVARSTGTNFGASYRANRNAICHPTATTCVAGNVRWRGDDILSIDRATGVLTLYGSNLTTLVEDTTFDTSRLTGLCAAPRLCKITDYDADGDGDIVILYNDLLGHVDVSRNLGASFDVPTRWVNNMCFNLGGRFKRDCSLGDVDGDRLPDLVIAETFTERVHVVRNGSTRLERRWHDKLCALGHECMSGDFDGDGYDDIVDFARSSEASTIGDVFVQSSIATY
jgi:hypothetical protein